LGIERSSDPLKVTAIDPTEQRAELTGKLHQLIRTQPDIIIIYLPNKDRLLGNNDPLSLYNTAKNVCIGAGVASQVIYEKTLLETKANADANIIMGILGKTGNIPYVLGEPLEYLDFVVGLDIARRANKNGGSINTAAMSRIYTNQGALLGYNIGPGALVEGETIPQSVLERILSPDEFSGKRVAIHRDGWFRGKEYEQIMNWGKYIKAEFYPIEVVKSGAARIYGETTNAHIIQATKGTAFGVNETLAYLVSSLPPSGKNGPFSTANPLQVNNRSRLTLQQALHSVLALTLLHYGSVRPPRLPVSTHASDKIASFLLRNIQPDKQKGDKPFWL
jgi:argonaute-like protein implicated in RNA metabolism and viral defense